MTGVEGRSPVKSGFVLLASKSRREANSPWRTFSARSCVPAHPCSLPTVCLTRWLATPLGPKLPLLVQTICWSRHICQGSASCPAVDQAARSWGKALAGCSGLVEDTRLARQTAGAGARRLPGHRQPYTHVRQTQDCTLPVLPTPCVTLGKHCMPRLSLPLCKQE